MATEEQRNTENEDEEKFDYNGELVFNGIVQTDVREDDAAELREQILDRLSEFERGTPGDEGSGSLPLDLDDYAEEENIGTDLQNLADEVIALEYRYEHYPQDPIEVVEYTDDGSEYSEAYPRSTRSVYLYWDYPDTLFVQGAQNRVGEVAPKINSSLDEDVGFEYPEFDTDFLLWMVIKDKVDDPLNSNIGVKKLHAGEITGDAPDFGRDTEVDESDNISQSLPILAGILLDLDVAMLEGDFTIGDYTINAKIYGSGRIRVYANNSLYDVSKLERILISYKFLSEFMDEHEQWKDSDPTEKYPHPRYFKELHDEANNQGANLQFDFTSLVRRFANLRGENPDNYDFEFEIHSPDNG